MSRIEITKSNAKIGDIKSFYIKKLIFSFLKEKQKLNMIIYNKELQNILFISIEDYKKMSGIYKTGEKNGKGREYILNTDILLFEGEYLNGSRNGEGKEYYVNGTVKFKGEFLNGKRNGKGNEYYLDGKLKFKGEFKEGKIWNGKGYDKNDSIEYEIKNGQGHIKLYGNEGDLQFEGEYLNGSKNGKGKEYYYNGTLLFEGEYLNDKRDGKGKEFYDYYSGGGIKFKGEFKEGKIWNEKDIIIMVKLNMK